MKTTKTRKVSWTDIRLGTADEIIALFTGVPAIYKASKIFEDGDQGLLLKRDISIRGSTLTPSCENASVNMGDLLEASSPMVELDIELKQLREEKDLLTKTLLQTADSLAANEYKLRCLEAAKQYREWKPVEFCREWTPCGCVSDEGKETRWCISNAVYYAAISIGQNQYQKKPWGVDCQICLQQVQPGKFRDNRIVIVDRESRFQTEEEAQAYLEGRKAALFKKYFVEDYPAVPAEYVSDFMWAGKLLPGYKEA